MANPKIQSLSFDPVLNAPADRAPMPPPVTTRLQALPFGELTWENFERLCYRLASQSERVEYVARYGRSGQAQQGIDLFVRLPSGKYEVWQAKRYETIAASKIKPIIDEFRKGDWPSKTERLVLATQASLADTKVQGAIEEEAAALKGMGITLVPCDGEELSKTLRRFPALVDDFFGRDWVSAFLGPKAAEQLGARLDGAEFARVRQQLLRYYDSHFHLLDISLAQSLRPGMAREAPPSLLERFAMPDVLVTETASTGHPAAQRDNIDGNSTETGVPSSRDRDDSRGRTRRVDYVRRTPLGPWLSSSQQLAVVGEAGSGKSTLLKCIALDILTDKGLFPEISRKWGTRLPIHVSFARWSRQSSASGAAAGLKDVVAEVVQPTLTADLLSLLNRAVDDQRILLLVDGLDEWADEQAARTTLLHILGFVETHGVPAIVSARPLGLNKIATIPASWAKAELAPLSREQQRNLARVWFEGAAARACVGDPKGESPGPLDARLEHFFAELGRDKRLALLAGTPLLLMGLVTLSLRQIALPRNKIEAIKRLTEMLIESHPVRRATEAGDTQPRFLCIPDADDRRALLAHLAFAMRMRNGGGAYDLKEARKTIATCLMDPTTFAFDKIRAEQAARELLSPNSETIGLIVERAPGEFGFAHAIFEEHLAAEHIQTWPFSEIASFVREKSGETLWRNTISTLTSLLDRPTEVENLVAIIEEACAEDVSRQNSITRDLLLADIAFGPSRKPAATGRRLIEAAIETIERGDWMLTRREVLKAALANLGDATAMTDILNRISRWSPRRQNYLGSLFEALASWPPSPELLTVLIAGLHDEERNAQRAAARTLGQLFAGRAEVHQQLQAIVRTTLDLSVAASALEALSIGWPGTQGLPDLHDRAAKSQDPTLKLVGIRGRAEAGRADETDRDTLIALLSDFSELDYWDRPAAGALLSRVWRDDPAVINLAIEATRRHGGRMSGMERTSAMYFLVCCSPSNASVANWVREELRQQYPFSLGGGAWDYLASFAKEHDDIRESVVATIKSEHGRAFLYYFHSLIPALRGDDLRDALVEIARSDDGLPRFWPVGILLDAWGRGDPVVASFLDEIASWEDEKLSDLAGRLPKIIEDPAVCRRRLFSIARQTKGVRFDLIAAGFGALGCDPDDSEVVDLLIAQVGEGAPAFDPGPALLTHFSANARVRQYALATLKGRSPPLETLARAYKDDPEIRAKVLGFANPLPATLRSEIVDAAADVPDGRQGLGTVLEDYDIEVDSELKIAASISYHRALARKARGASADHLAKLHRDLHAVGPDLHERRAAAFAGLLILGRVGDIIPMMEWGDKPLNIRSGRGYGQESDSLMAVMAAHWDELSQAFGAEIAGRFGDFGSDEGHLWDCLAPHLSASEAARRGFLEFVDRTDTTLGLRSFLALARERPSSDALLRHCWRVFGRVVTGQGERHSAWAVRRIRLEIAYILREHFRGRTDVAEHLRESIKRGLGTEIAALILFNAADPLLDQIPLSPMEIALNHADWVTAAHLASARSIPEDFVAVVLEMINRESHDIWGFQEVANRAVVERLRRDPATVELVRARLDASPTPSEIASLPRYLSVAAALDEGLARRCSALLEREAQEPLVRAGYDAIDDAVRSVSRSLLEVIAPPFAA